MNGCFITGTDTGIGKTYIASSLLRELKVLGVKAAPFKPVVSGMDENGINSDIQSLIHASGFSGNVEEVCPYVFKPAIAPHMAAELAGESIALPIILSAFNHLATSYETVIVEGAGGWRVPISGDHDMQSLAIALNLPVIVVIGIRLGCINHGLLTLESVARSNVPIAGWIANHLEGRSNVAEKNVEALRTRSPISLLGECAYESRDIGWAPEFNLAEWIDS